MYVIQERIREWEPWETLTCGGVPKRYSTIEEAKAVLQKRVFPSICRIAEEYTVIRYKAVK